MKKCKIITILITIICISLNAKSQYISLLTNGNQWNVHRDWANPINYSEIYRIGYDTVIANEIWKRIIYTKDSAATAVFNSQFFLREDTINKKLYALKLGQSPHLYFDFNANVNDTLLLYNPFYNMVDTFIVTQIASEILGGITRKKFTTNHPIWFLGDTWIEGIGSLGGIYYGNKPSGIVGNQFALLCFSNNNQQIYPAQPTNICYLSNVGITLITILSPSIYPNPATDFLQIENLTDRTHAEIYSINGKLQKSISLSENGSVNINDLAEGIYFIKFQNDNGIVCKKFIKNKQ